MFLFDLSRPLFFEASIIDPQLSAPVLLRLIRVVAS
jgi:hypothetical protein